MVTNSKEYARKYYLENKDKYKHVYNKKVYCDTCDEDVLQVNLTRHNKSKLHTKLLKMQTKSKPSKVDKVLNDIDTMIAKDIEPKDFK